MGAEHPQRGALIAPTTGVGARREGRRLRGPHIIAIIAGSAVVHT